MGAVHGTGLYLGLELVADRATRAPAAAQAAAVCDRLRALGVVCQPAGARGNVLKMKPPLSLSAESADFVVAQVDAALSSLRAESGADSEAAADRPRL